MDVNSTECAFTIQNSEYVQKEFFGLNISRCSLQIHPVSGSFIFLFSMHNIFLSCSCQSPSFTFAFTDGDIKEIRKDMNESFEINEKKKYLSLIVLDCVAF